MSSKEKPKQPVRGQMLGAFIAAQRLQGEGVQQPGARAQATSGQEQRFTLENTLGKVDELRLQIRERSGFRPGLLMDRRNQRRTEFFQAFNQSHTTKIENPEPEQVKPAAPAQPAKPMFTCPWNDAGCTFTSDNPDALRSHVVEHTRFHPRTY